MRPFSKFFLILSLGLFLGISCTKVPPQVFSLSEAQKRFIEICKKEYGMDVRAFPVQDTLYIYLPTQEPFFDYKAAEAKPQEPPPEQTEKLAINYLATDFQDRKFVVRYDISKQKIYPPKDQGFSTIYTEKFNKNIINLNYALYQAYGEFLMDHLPGDKKFLDGRKQMTHEEVVRFQSQKGPDFVVFIIADIKRGMEVRTTVSFTDFKRYMTQSLSQEEYTKRYLSELTGWAGIVGDTQGNHIDLKEISWPEFLSSQITNRVKFKYQTSDFPPGEDTKKEMLKIIGHTAEAYGFEDFQAVELNDLVSGEKTSEMRHEL